MRMRTDKLITIIFSTILGVIGLFTIYILGSSFLYDTGVIGGGDEYESLESLLKEEKDTAVDTTTASAEEVLSVSQPQPSENEVGTTQSNKNEETVKFEEEPKEVQNQIVKEPVRTTVIPGNPEETSSSTTLRTSSSSGSSVSKRAQFEELKKKFNYGTDATGTGWFVHEVWDNPGLTRNALICYVNQSGEINLVTQYVGEERLSHTEAQIQVGRNTLSTGKAFEDDINVSSAGGNIKERAQYRSGNNKAIVDQIVSNMQLNVSITLVGDDQTEFTLSNVDKQALRECKEMADLLSYL